MKLTEVKSSNIQAIGYNETSHVLYVQYSGGTYEYTDVPPAIYDGLKEADSKGRFMNENVKSYFKYRKSSEKFEKSI